MHRALLLDLDDTLYSYYSCHTASLTAVLKKWNLSQIDYDIAYGQIKHTYSHIHDRKLYFSRMFLNSGLSDESYDACDLYWKTFYNHMEIYPGVKEFIQWNIDHGIEVCIVSNFDRDVQLRKLSAIGLDIKHIVTCTDAGVDKPHYAMFALALKLTKCPAEECLMIGDDHATDILGAMNAGINNCLHFGVDFTSWNALLVRYNYLQQDLGQFVSLSKHYGERQDMVQGAGGNISVKISDAVVIKASGCRLSDVSDNYGYVVVNKDGTHKYKVGKPSIETAFHVKLNAKYVVHLHPISVIMTTRDEFKKMFPEAKALPYIEPGQAIADALNETNSIVYLENHGLIVSGNNPAEVGSLLDKIVNRCSEHIGFDQTLYDTLSMVSDGVRKNNPQYVTIPTDLQLNNIKIYTPDIAVYVNNCKITQYMNKYYISAKTLSQCHDAESVLTAMQNISMSTELTSDQIDTLINRIDERYRMK